MRFLVLLMLGSTAVATPEVQKIDKAEIDEQLRNINEALLHAKAAPIVIEGKKIGLNEMQKKTPKKKAQSASSSRN